MANYSGQGSDSFVVGSTPPNVTWTVVKGDTASFRVYVTDDEKNPLNIADWNLDMDIYRPTSSSVIVSLTPAVTPDDEDGEFTVSLTSVQSELLRTDDIFDIQMTQPATSKVWTIAKGYMVMIEDVTN